MLSFEAIPQKSQIVHASLLMEKWEETSSFTCPKLETCLKWGTAVERIELTVGAFCSIFFRHGGADVHILWFFPSHFHANWSNDIHCEAGSRFKMPRSCAHDGCARTDSVTAHSQNVNATSIFWWCGKHVGKLDKRKGPSFIFV